MYELKYFLINVLRQVGETLEGMFTKLRILELYVYVYVKKEKGEEKNVYVQG